jgi:hypothetical protein
LQIRYIDVLERRKKLSRTIGYYNHLIEKLDLPVVVQRESDAVFRIWEWSCESMIIDTEIREKLKKYLQEERNEQKR